jgi:NADH-quinone oxidoreductase subunit J
MSLSNGVLEELAFMALSLIALGSGLAAVSTAQSVYAAIALGFTGTAVAGLIALLGFGYVAAFHLLVYVGATVTFMVFSVVMLRQEPRMLRGLTLASALNAALLGLIFYMVAVSTGIGGAAPRINIDLGHVSSAFIEQYWFPLLLVVASLATIMIEGIVVARGEKK